VSDETADHLLNAARAVVEARGIQEYLLNLHHCERSEPICRARSCEFPREIASLCSQ
jgi:hypothetical protein